MEEPLNKKQFDVNEVNTTEDSIQVNNESPVHDSNSNTSILQNQNQIQTKNVEAETTNDDNSFIKFLSYCGACKEHLEGRYPKLLPCLHTICSACLNLEIGGKS